MRHWWVNDLSLTLTLVFSWYVPLGVVCISRLEGQIDQLLLLASCCFSLSFQLHLSTLMLSSPLSFCQRKIYMLHASYGIVFRYFSLALFFNCTCTLDPKNQFSRKISEPKIQKIQMSLNWIFDQKLRYRTVCMLKLCNSMTLEILEHTSARVRISAGGYTL